MNDEINRMKEANRAYLRDIKKLSAKEQRGKAIKISTAIESTQRTQQGKAVVNRKNGSVKAKEKELKNKKISIRLTESQYREITKKCKNKEGEQLITITDFIRQAVLSKKNKIIAQEHPLDRFKLAVASEIAVGITDIVHFIDSELDQCTESYAIDDCLEIIERLELLEERASYLLMPTTEYSENKKIGCTNDYYSN